MDKQNEGQQEIKVVTIGEDGVAREPKEFDYMTLLNDLPPHPDPEGAKALSDELCKGEVIFEVDVPETGTNPLIDMLTRSDKP